MSEREREAEGGRREAVAMNAAAPAILGLFDTLREHVCVFFLFRLKAAC